MNDESTPTAWGCEPGLITVGQTHHVVFNVDAAPRSIAVIVDGQLCEGGDIEGRSFGYTRFGDSGAPLTDKDLGNVSGGADASVSPALQHLRIYGHYLTTSEAVANFHSDLPPKS